MCKRNIFYISKTYTKYHNNYQTLKQTHCVNTIFVKVLILYSSLHIALFKFKPSWGKIFTDQTKGIIFEYYIRGYKFKVIVQRFLDSDPKSNCFSKRSLYEPQFIDLR